MIEVRPAWPPDAEAMATVQNAIHRAGLRATPVDTDGVRERHLDEVHSIACTVAVDDGRVVGFQSLKRAWIDNPYGVPVGWGIIGTHIHPDVGRRGIGRRLFVVAHAAAEAAGLRHIDATIRADNAPALAYYSSLGFVPYRQEPGSAVVPHRYDV
ncbi:GNAT family N-acetyltransferase [Williamsia serinedens]|uniref:GNAT family N-acetyltransferase n=1 Tax=Williamsia serinedens TaxID=391736 RepID=UPI0020A48FE5|nr:GNAT family N-acetyltransferase [Williamsia serinedens]